MEEIKHTENSSIPLVKDFSSFIKKQCVVVETLLNDESFLQTMGEDPVFLIEELPSFMLKEENNKESLKDTPILEEHFVDMHEVIPQPKFTPVAEQVDSDGDDFWEEMEFFSHP